MYTFCHRGAKQIPHDLSDGEFVAGSIQTDESTADVNFSECAFARTIFIFPKLRRREKSCCAFDK